MATKARILKYNFLGAGLPVDFGSAGETPFRKSSTGAGSVNKSSYGLQLNVTAATSLQAAELNQGNVLAFSIDELQTIEFDCRFDSLTEDAAGLDFIVGIIGARNDDADAITPSLFIRIKEGNVVCESNDGNGLDVNDVDADAAINFGVWQRYVIDLASGIASHGPPSKPVGGKARPVFKVTGNNIGNQSLVGVHENTSLSMEQYSGSVQLFARAAKTNAASANDCTMTIREICVEAVDVN